MNNNKKVNGGFSSGYKIKNGKNIVINRNNNKSSKGDFDDLQYPNGMIPFIFISLFFVISTVCIFSIGFSQFYDVFKIPYTWTNSLISCVTMPFLLTLLWAIGRTGIATSFGYSMLKFSRNLKLNKIRQKVEFYMHTPAIDDVDTIEDFQEFSAIRKVKSTKWFWICFITYSIIFVIGLIVGLSLQKTL